MERLLKEAKGMDTRPKRYTPAEAEPKWQAYWEDQAVNRFNPGKESPVYSIDTPPLTVSGDIHMGHCYSYSHADFYARFQRMKGAAVFYPNGWDDNGLPTERLVENRLGINPEKAGKEIFLQTIIETSKTMEEKYEQLWRRLGLSMDWRYNYSTINASSRKTAQYSFLELYRKERVYQSSSPAVWCPLCKTAIADAEVTDMSRQTEYITLPFTLEDGQTLPIATTRPELLAACVAVLVNPADRRYAHLAGRQAVTPIYQKQVPIVADTRADPEKGTGAVMCCTFGDSVDVRWWREFSLPLINILDRDGRLNADSGFLAGRDIKTARQKIIEELAGRGLVLDRKASAQTVSVHERCDTPVEYLATRQWFVKVLDRKESLLEAGRKIQWNPPHMLARYEDWVKNLEWDWCISRQRYHGAPFPLWYCLKCGRVLLAETSALPIDPRLQQPSGPCLCGSREFAPETSVMDTWMTSSVSPQIAGRWLAEPELFSRVFPMSLRPQAHDIIRTWTFYTIVKSLYHFGQIPWSHIAISGHGLSPEGHKVSKSRGGSSLEPLKVMEKYSADAIRYWSACTKLGEDSMISEDKIAAGQKLINKLWSVSGFAYPFLKEYPMAETIPELLPADKWVLSSLQGLVRDATEAFNQYDHTLAKIKIEDFFWSILADNYLEMIKNRLYDLPDRAPEKEAAMYTLSVSLSNVIKLLAPLMPYITEEIFQVLFKEREGAVSIHLAKWPVTIERLMDAQAEITGGALVAIATSVRRYKSERQIPMGSPLDGLQIAAPPGRLLADLKESIMDIRSITRGQNIEFVEEPAGAEMDEPPASSVWVTVKEGK
jgi:valyl-tRNA synthetase